MLAAMDGDTRRRFKSLLLDLPFWTEQRKRAEFVTDVFYGHEIQKQFRSDGDGSVVAGELLDLCIGYDAPAESGDAPLCALLAGIREHNLAAGARAGVVADLARHLGCASRKPAWPHDPYPGLLAFDYWQAPIFFGRAVETRELLRRLETDQGRRFLLVTGASGSGKSSLVRAGVWAALTQGTVSNMPGSGDWLITAMFPAEQKEQDGSADPFRALTSSLRQHPRLGWVYPGDESEKLRVNRAAAFADLLRRALEGFPTNAEWLLILDQMEELFTPACEASREAFLDLLLAAAELPRFRVIATVRSDFFPSCEAHDGLHAVLNNPFGHYSAKAPGPRALGRMVSGPVEEVKFATPIALDPVLADRMVDDAVSEPGGLALLAFALKDLYEQCRQSGRMDLAVYEGPSFGGLKGVIQRRADRALERAGADGRAALPRVFSRLLTVRPDGTATRRREDKRLWAGDAPAEALLAEFTRRDTRLLIVGPDDRPTVEVAHEALLREWPTLVTWIEERREALRLCDKIQEETRTWVRQARPTTLLWKHELLEDRRRLLAEADLLADLERDPDIADFLIPEADWLLAELVCGITDHPSREAIGMRLSEIGDPRPGVGLREDGLPDILWCAIPDGEVEVEGHGRFQVHRCNIAAYPVTYAQYKAFLEAKDGYRSKRWWQDLHHEPEPGRQLRAYASYPADNVSWYQATAFCRWLSSRLDFEVRLPDEWEWQWAAQSARRDFSYPWGPQWCEGLANTNEAGIGRTTAVGMYPGGQSLQGIDDLAGNVWEWCRNQLNNPRKTGPGGDGSRVLRGGSWNDNQDNARADYRNVNHPVNRNDHYGFRVLCASPIR
jgi:hypothetical protein